MVILVIYVLGVLADEPKRHPPVAAHFHRPSALPHTLEFVQVHARQIHIARVGGSVQSAKEHPEAISIFRLNTLLAPGDEEGLEPLMPTILDRHRM